MPALLIPALVTGLTLVGLAATRGNRAACSAFNDQEQRFANTLLQGHDNDEIRRRFVGMNDLQITGWFYTLAAKAEAGGCPDVADKLRARAIKFGRDE